MKSKSTRRDFLAISSLACAGTFLRTRGLNAQVLPARIGASSLSADAVLPDPVVPDALRALALQAVDAAKSAGASYADFRISEGHRLSIGGIQLEPHPTIYSRITFGVRVIAGGRMACVHGNTPTSDAVTTAARNAVKAARGYARAATRPVELAPVPVVTGEWETPYREDPFTVPLRDQRAVRAAFDDAGLHVRDTSWLGAVADFTWTRDRRVFASSEGTLLTQTIRNSRPFVICEAYPMQYGDAFVRFTGLLAQSGGFETVNDPALREEFKRHMEFLVGLSGLPHRTLDVGRYPVIFDGRTLGAVLGQTLGPALELDRIVGDEADGAGTSFVTPPADYLGQPVASPLLTVKCNRALPSVTAVKWDDEGVEASEFPLITAGQLNGFPASRSTVAALNKTESQLGSRLRLQGCSVALDAGDVPIVRTPHLAVSPSTTKASVDDLYKGMARGILVVDRQGMTTDQQCASGFIQEYYGDGLMLLIEKGKIVGRLRGVALQFGTKSMWTRQLMSLGDASTLQDCNFETYKGMPAKNATQSARAPAGLFKDVDVISTEISL